MKNETYTLLISAGRGPEECAFVVAEVWPIILGYLKENKYPFQILEKRPAKYKGCYRSITVEITGIRKPQFQRDWLGTIKWIGKSPFRKNHQRNNWFIGCFLFETPASIYIDMKDVIITSFRSSGPGGQHRNKVETAVRLIHKKLGLTVEAAEHRSQHQNKTLALEKLKKAIKMNELNKQQKLIDKQWKQSIELERGNPIKTFRGNSFKIAT